MIVHATTQVSAHSPGADPARLEVLAAGLPPINLYENGFRDLIPVAPPGVAISAGSHLKPIMLGKAPGIRYKNGSWGGFAKWLTFETTIDDVREWMTWGANVGLRSKHFPGLDIDSLDPKIADAIEMLAHEHLGGAPVRFGLRPKRLMMYQTAEPFGRLRVWGVKGTPGKDDHEKHLVEFLGDGQQYLVYGIHPTGVNYEWIEDMRTLLPDSLTPITKTQAEAFREAVARYFRTLELEVSFEGDGTPPSKTAVDQKSLLAPGIDHVYEAMKFMRNDGDFDERQKWLNMAYALKGACGVEYAHEAKQMFIEWSMLWPGDAKHPGGNDLAVVEAEYDRCSGDPRVGYSWLCEKARGYGFNNAQEDFDVLDRAPNEGTAPSAPLPTKGERIAALLHDAGAAFLFEADALPDGELLSRWKVLARAAQTEDPLERMFLNTVVPSAQSYGRYNLSQFSRLLDARLCESARWTSLEQQDRTVLIHAAFVLVVGPSAMTAPLPRLISISGDPSPPRDLVAGILPEMGTGMVVGPPNEGKSFVAGDLAGRVASNMDTFGGLRINRHGPVLYFASEDPHGLRSRFAHWSAAHKQPLDRFNLFDRVLTLTDLRDALTQVMSAIDEAKLLESPALIIIDTMRDALGSEDENDSGAAANASRIAQILSRMFGALILLVHHSPHSDPARERGSSAFGASVDVKLSVRQDGKTIIATVRKNRRGPKGGKHLWHLQVNGHVAVLHPGPDGPDKPSSTSDQRDGDARLVAKLLPGFASVGHPASSRQLKDALAEACSGMWDSPDAKTRSASVRRSRAIHRAIQLEWVTVQGKGRYLTYTPGPKTPTPAELDLLEDLP